MLIKVLLLLAIVAIAWFFLRSAAGSRGRAVRTLSVLAFALVAALSVVFPEMLTVLANAVGVGRGTDLLLYALVVVVLASMAATQRRAKGFEVQLTRLARRQALDDAEPQFAKATAAHEAVAAPAHEAVPGLEAGGSHAARAENETEHIEDQR